METRIVDDMAVDEIRALFASATRLTIPGKEKTLDGEELGRFKRFLEVWLPRNDARAKVLLAGRRASEITPEEKDAILSELVELSVADEARADTLSEGPFVKRQNEVRDKMRRCFEESGSWHKVYTTEVYSDSLFCAEAFIDLVEQKTGKKVNDALHLLALTGLAGETDTMEGFERTLRQARESQYERALVKKLDEGAKYKDLLEIDPESFGLIGDVVLGTEEELRKEEDAEIKEMEAEGHTVERPLYTRWDEYKTIYKQKEIRRVLSFWAFWDEASFWRPDLRKVADSLEAPFWEIWAAAQVNYDMLGKKI